MQTFEEILAIITTVCKGRVPSVDPNSTPKSINVHLADLLSAMEELQNNPKLFFDSLSCVTGIDNGPAAGAMEIAYNLYSIPFNHHIMIKVKLPRESPRIESVSQLWRTADWHEREIYDMFGIIFENHPDLRRILLPADWDGHPLRKDYKQQEYYRDIKLQY